MMTAVIEVTGLTKRYGGRRAQAVVDDISFHVDAGEIFGSHFMDEVEELCDRVAILERGRIAALDTPAGLVDRAGGEYRVRFRPMAQPTSRPRRCRR
jgi:ABC-type multidrug transport system ATPase subunit